MIISASRRTDIPSYYGTWFVNRLREGYVLIQNPYNALRLSRLPLSPDTTDCIVFWTKNPAPMLTQLSAVSDLGYRYYFQYTLTPYGRSWESNLPPIEERIDTFCRLSETIGRERVVWRYDPIILDADFSVEYHTEQFSILCESLSPYTKECVISFVDVYAHNRRILQPISSEQMQAIAESFSVIAKSCDLKLSTCSEKIDLQKYGIAHASCIDPKRIEKIIGCPIQAKKDAGQRLECGCIESVDIGTYGTCQNGCRYCYATKSASAARQNARCHDPASPMLVGWPKENMLITERKVSSAKVTQLSFL